MANSTNGLFVSTTDNYDLTRLEGKDLGSVEFRQLIVKLMNRTNNIALSLNQKDSGIYQSTEFNTGQTFQPNSALSSNTPQLPQARSIFRVVIITGQLPNAGTKTVAHNLTFDTNVTMVKLYGAASDTIHQEYIPLPFVSVSGAFVVGNVELYVDGTNINITTTGNGSDFNQSYVVIEYLKN